MVCYACDAAKVGGVFRRNGCSSALALKGSKLLPACARHATVKRQPKG